LISFIGNKHSLIFVVGYGYFCHSTPPFQINFEIGQRINLDFSKKLFCLVWGFVCLVCF